MLYLPDINILIYAKMSGMNEHTAATAWLDAAIADPDSTILLCETTILAFLRIATNSKAFDPPLGFSKARSFVEKLLGHSRSELFRPTPKHFIDVADLMKKLKFGGNLTMDAHLAAIALSKGAILVTRDADFKKIPYLKILNPLT